MQKYDYMGNDVAMICVQHDLGLRLVTSKTGTFDVLDKRCAVYERTQVYQSQECRQNPVPI
jgi:hypothetical protein